MLGLARASFALVGAVALLAGVGQLTGALTGSARLDWLPVVWGVALGLGALAAAAWVRTARGPRAVAAWTGIAAVLATSLWPLYYLVSHPDAGPDVMALALIPTLVGLTCSSVMAVAHWRGRPRT